MRFPMKNAVAVYVALLLAISAGGQTQLCKHQSGPFHVLVEAVCDGLRAHEEDHGHKHEHDHSQHHATGEHHEQCSHEVVSSDDEYPSANSGVSVGLPVWLEIFSLDDFVPSDWFAKEKIQYVHASTRGPPVKECTLGYFALSIRLLI